LMLFLRYFIGKFFILSSRKRC